MIDNPFRLSIEKWTAGMNIHLVIIYQRPVSSLRILFSRMEEEPWDNCFPDESTVPFTWGHFKSVSLKELNDLIADILCPLESSILNEVILAPPGRVILVLPSLVDCQHCQVVTFGVIELSFLLICQCFLFLRAIEDVWNRKHRDNRDYLLAAPEINWS